MTMPDDTKVAKPVMLSAVPVARRAAMSGIIRHAAAGEAA